MDFDIGACLFVGFAMLMFALALLWFQSGGASWEAQRKIRHWPNPRLSPRVGDYERELMEKGLEPNVPPEESARKDERHQ
ncbi:MAG TPA: hypothetical protein VFR15_01580 [Chloroflexia bacterium]|nr:hypothetical protein [Chloroflexia bacterium]